MSDTNRRRWLATIVGLPAAASIGDACGPSQCHTLVVSKAEGFDWTRRKNGDVIISHHGRIAATLRGRSASDFLDQVSSGNEQDLMARLTGNYKRGNERDARRHPRNRHR